MTMKTKRRLAIGGGTTLCAVLTILIAITSIPENEQQLTANVPETSSVSTVITLNKEKPESINNNGDADNISGESSADPQIESDYNAPIENNTIVIEQDIPDIETEQSVPAAPPEIEDEPMLTTPNTEPTYTPEQHQPDAQITTAPTPASTPRHGDTKDGMIYINGFGWVRNDGGGGIGEPASDMYENGNKIGSFG